MINHRLIAGILFVLALSAASMAQNSVQNSKHNLTSTGPGSIRAGGTGEACIYCHTPHAANPVAPLWNRADTGQVYQTYDSPTLKAQVGQPSGSSRLCLSCHDGTIALGQTYNPNNSAASTVYLSPGDAGYLGTDLRDDHPVSFTYDTALSAQRGELRDPTTLPPHLPLDQDRQLQCTTCHDPHDDGIGQFLRMSNRESALCVSCHQMTDWTTNPHATSTRPLNAAARDDWSNLRGITTVREAGCQSCHRSHSGGGRPWLMRRDIEEDNCYSCHDGTVAQTNVLAVTANMSSHPVGLTTATHVPGEIPSSMVKHVECSDCHSPHRMQASGPSTAPLIKPVMAGAAGVTDSGVAIDSATYEYEVCYKCHGFNNVSDAVVTRYSGTNNIADEFAATNASFHPVQVPTGTTGPSLLPGFTSSTILYCTSCHGSDDPGVQGPHGSRFGPLLKANYSTLDNTGESPEAYAMCYTCHNRESILANESFSEHRRHIEDKKVPCSACHDPHGVRENDNLINFDRAIVQDPGPGVPVSYQDTGNRRGSCTVKCHGETHVNESYPDD